MKTLFLAVTLVSLSLAFSSARAADEWGIEHEKVVRFEAKVVDIACELTGNCPKACGAGKRQLGLLQKSGRLLLVAKNNDIFAGAVDDLVQFCNKNIIADGLLIENPKMPLFALQFKRPAPDGKWSRADWFLKNWAKANPGKDPQQWFRHDVRITTVIAKDGIFGIPGLKPEKD